MEDGTIREISNKLENVMIELRGISVQVTIMKEMINKFDATKDIANDALASTKAAHLRLDEIMANQTWLWRTVLGSLLVGAVTFLWKGMG